MIESESPSEITPKPHTLMVALVLIFVWGIAYTMIGVAVKHISPIWIVSGRCILGAILVTAYMTFKGHRLPSLRDKAWLYYAGLAMTGMVLPFWLISVGQVKVESGISSILVSAMPLMTIVLAHFFVDEALTWRKFIGFVIGFAGIIILFLPDDFSLSLIENWPSQLCILGAALFYAITTVAAKKAPDVPSLVGASMMLIFASVAATLWAVTTGLPQGPIPPIAWAMIVGLAVGSTGIGTILYLYFIKMAGASAMAKVNYFPPLVSVAAGIWLLNEEFEWRIIIALVVILIGVSLTREARKKAN